MFENVVAFNHNHQPKTSQNHFSKSEPLRHRREDNPKTQDATHNKDDVKMVGTTSSYIAVTVPEN
jgi:hypothetical protein